METDKGVENTEGYKGCDGTDECLPKWLSCGWLASPYTWYYLVLTTLAIVVLYACANHASKDPFYNKLKKPPGDAGVSGLTTGWLIAYIGMAIAMIVAAWKASDSKAICLAVVYTILLFALACWESAYFVQYMFEWGVAAIVLSIILILWLIWMVSPCRTRCEGTSKFFPYIWLFLVFGWMLVVLYYTISHVVMKSSSLVGKRDHDSVELISIVGSE